MACSNSNCNTPSCGCSGTYVVSQTCPPACSEVFNSSCIVYTGVDITCENTLTGLSSTVVSRNDYLDSALTSIVNFFCTRVNEALTATNVVSGDAYIAVASAVAGSVTTYTITLDPTSLPSASIVTGGANAVVTGTGSAVDPYVVNANESIVAVDPASALTLIVDPSTPGPYETTYTLGIDNSSLPDTFLQTSFGHINIVDQQDVPTAGDTTYTLEVDEVTITSIDPKLDVVLTNAGGVAPFTRTFTVDVDETEMGNFIMDTAGANIVAAGGITVAYDAIAHQITIGETIGIPDQWKIISDGVTDITAGSATDKLRVVAGTGASVGLASGPGANEATFTITNTDLGSDQLIFGTVDCNNGGPSVGTCAAATNTDALTLVGGDDITLGVAGNTITINNDIDHVYSNVIADSGGTLQAASTTSELEVLGGTAISTVGAAGPSNSITINNDGVTSAVAGEGITLSGATGAVTITADVAKYILSSVAAPGAGGTIAINHALAEEDVVVTVRETGAAGAGFYAGVDYSLTFTDGNNLVITDIGGGLGAGTLRVSVMG